MRLDVVRGERDEVKVREGVFGELQCVVEELGGGITSSLHHSY